MKSRERLDFIQVIKFTEQSQKRKNEFSGTLSYLDMMQGNVDRGEIDCEVFATIPSGWVGAVTDSHPLSENGGGGGGRAGTT